MNVAFVMVVFISLIIPKHGVATYYTHDMYGGNPLYCSRVGNPLHYTPDYMIRYDWVAVDIKMYQSGEVKCWDTLRVTFEDGAIKDVLALDAGPLYKYYIEDWPDLPILVDFEESAWPFDNRMSAVVDVLNLSALNIGQHE